VRWPASDVVDRLTARCGPLIVTSANRSGRPPASTALEVEVEFGDDVDLVVDGGPCGDTASTVVWVAVGEVRILRTGDVGQDAIDAALADLP
jgi:tRNA A37 threonylcarbamoyladenosine synthetase subunit TsaC/SUA5/YrdC